MYSFFLKCSGVEVKIHIKRKYSSKVGVPQNFYLNYLTSLPE